MTAYRCTWGAPFDQTRDFDTEIAAETWAVGKSAEIGEPVAVSEWDEGESA